MFQDKRWVVGEETALPDINHCFFSFDQIVTGSLITWLGPKARTTTSTGLYQSRVDILSKCVALPIFFSAFQYFIGLQRHI